MSTDNAVKCKSAIFLVSRGYTKRTGYFFRCRRDQQVLEEIGYTTKTINVSNLGIIQFLRSRQAFSEYRTALGSSNLVVLENYGALAFYWLESMLAYRRRTKIILVCHGSLDDLRMFRWYHLRRSIYALAEKRMINRLLAVACVSEVMKHEFGRKFPKLDSKFICTPNLPGSNFYRQIEKESQIALTDLRATRGLPEDRKLLMYVGNCQQWQNLELLISVCTEIQKKTNDFHFVFLSQQVDLIQKMLERAGVRNGEYSVRKVDNSEIPGYLLAADFLYIVRTQDEINRVACPTKAVEYLISGRPIIVSESLGDVSDMVREAGRGIVVSKAATTDARALVSEILEFSSAPGANTMSSVATALDAGIYDERHNFNEFSRILP